MMLRGTSMAIGLALAIAAAVGVTAGPADQTRTLFAGTWTAVPPEPGAAPQGLAGPWAPEVTLTQDYLALTVEYVSSSRSHAPVRLVYNMDGSERRNPELNGSAPHERVTRAISRGRDIILTTIWPRLDPGPIEFTEVLSLISPDTLSVTLTRRFKDEVATGTWTFKRK